jgi:chromosomal replication initiator protein
MEQSPGQSRLILSPLEWQRCLETIANRLDSPVRSVLNGSRLLESEPSHLKIGIQGAFSRDFLTRRVNQDNLIQALQEFTGNIYSVELTVIESSEPVASNASVQVMSHSESLKTDNEASSGELSLNPRYTFSSFIRGSGNTLAAAASMAVAESPAKAYNPLFLYGGVGLGKTHLMNAIGHEVFRHRRKARVVYMSAERFTNEMIDSISEAKMNRFRRNYRNVDVLLIDDIQFLANKERTQEEFFHTFNELHGANKQIVISSDRPPRQIPTLEDRLRSRFEWGMIADIQPPDLETRIAILRKKAEQCNVAVSQEVCQLIAEHIRVNIRELEGALTRLIACASLQNRPITLDLAKEVLASISPDSAGQTIDIRQIIEAVCEYFSLSQKDLIGSRRDQKIVRPRHVAMYLCKELTGASYPEIALQFGGKDHTTVLHAYRKVESNLVDHYYKTSIENIHNRLRGFNR